MEIGTFARHLDQVQSAEAFHPEFIDLRMDLNFNLDFRQVRMLLTEYNMACTLHLPSDPCWRAMDLPKEIVPYIDLGAQVEAELVTTHTALSPMFYSDEDIDAYLEWIPLASDAAKESGMQLAVETLGSFYTELALLFERCPDIKIALDIGHGQIMATRNRALDIIESFYERIAMVNVHDNHGQEMVDEVQNIRKRREVTHEELLFLARKYDEHLPIGEGDIDFAPIFRELKEREFSGKFLMMSKDSSNFVSEREKFTKFWLEA